MATKSFAARTILTVTTGRLLTKAKGNGDNGIGDLYELLNWMTSDNLFTHQLGRASEECKPWLVRWFPELKAIGEQIEAACESKQEFESMLPETIYDVPKISADDHVVKDPYDELVEMRGTDAGIAVIHVDSGSKAGA